MLMYSAQQGDENVIPPPLTPSFDTDSISEPVSRVINDGLIVIQVNWIAENSLEHIQSGKTSRMRLCNVKQSAPYYACDA
jgi:hypothetical protein